jgi:hypothetical protein
MKENLESRRMVKVVMSTLEGTIEIEVDDEGNNKELQLHVNLENLRAIDKTLEALRNIRISNQPLMKES